MFNALKFIDRIIVASINILVLNMSALLLNFLFFRVG
ncbi:hypothetical protein BMETH_979_0 [methanotrophic bacterial endosymbiont of Bathymodiolus sp.]|nr:hypothetical protein BMETH_979_0 [methanotrophic bacterial endosymbiont of Bathymodiolus sp.]